MAAQGKGQTIEAPVEKPAVVDYTPRIVKQGARAPLGMKRFKIRADYPYGSPTEYVLARDEDAARKEYLRATLLDAWEAKQQAAWKADGSPEHRKPAPPILVVTALPD